MKTDELFQIVNRNHDRAAYVKRIDEAIEMANRPFYAKQAADAEKARKQAAWDSLVKDFQTYLLMVTTVLAAADLVMLVVLLWSIYA